MADPGKGPGRPAPYFYVKMRPEGPKKFLRSSPPHPHLSQGLDDWASAFSGSVPAEKAEKQQVIFPL